MSLRMILRRQVFASETTEKGSESISRILPELRALGCGLRGDSEIHRDALSVRLMTAYLGMETVDQLLTKACLIVKQNLSVFEQADHLSCYTANYKKYVY